MNPAAANSATPPSTPPTMAGQYGVLLSTILTVGVVWYANGGVRSAVTSVETLGLSGVSLVVGLTVCDVVSGTLSVVSTVDDICPSTVVSSLCVEFSAGVSVVFVSSVVVSKEIVAVVSLSSYVLTSVVGSVGTWSVSLQSCSHVLLNPGKVTKVTLGAGEVIGHVSFTEWSMQSVKHGGPFVDAHL